MATFDTLIDVTVNLATARAQRAGFGILRYFVPLSANPMDGDRTREYTSSADVASDLDDTFISATTAAQLTDMLSQEHDSPDTVSISYYDDSASVAAVKASKDFGDVGGGNFDTTIEAHTAGEDGNDLEIVLVPDSSSGVSIEIIDSVVLIHYKGGTSTVGNVETAITALSGANDIIDVKTGGTGATVLAAADAVESKLAGGSDAVAAETMAQALAAAILDNDNFYGVALQSRTNANQAAMAAAVLASASSKKMLFVGQSADAGWYGTPDAAFTDTLANGRCAMFWHDVGAEPLAESAGAACLAVDPDVRSGAWHAFQVTGVAAYSSPLTQAQSNALLANNVNGMQSMVGIANVVQKGTLLTGTPIYELISADWFEARLQEDIAEFAVNLGNVHKKLPLNQKGWAMLVAVVESRLRRGARVEHIDPAYTIDPYDDDSVDVDAKTISVTGNAQILGAATNFNITVNLGEDPVPAAAP